jgi:hypothetical protein
MAVKPFIYFLIIHLQTSKNRVFKAHINTHNVVNLSVSSREEVVKSSNMFTTDNLTHHLKINVPLIYWVFQ